MAALTAAGAAGVQVKELAEAIGTKAVNIHSWFHSTIKRNPEIKKISGGHYRLHGGASKSSQQKSSTADQVSADRKTGKAPGAGSQRTKGNGGAKASKKTKPKGTSQRASSAAAFSRS
jgi:uncharacterized protein YjcR